MTTWRQGDEERTKEVLEGKRPATENGKTWLRHKEGTSCYISLQSSDRGLFLYYRAVKISRFANLINLT